METLQPNQFEKILSSQEKLWLCSMLIGVLFVKEFKPIFETSANTFTNSQQKFYESNIVDDNNPLWERFS